MDLAARRTTGVQGAACRNAREAQGACAALQTKQRCLQIIVAVVCQHQSGGIQGTRALVKGSIRNGRDPFLRIVRVVAKAAYRFGRRLDIGNACKNVVDGDFGHICVCVYGEVLAGVQCDTGTDIELVLAELQEIVAGSLSTTAGVAQ